MKKLKLKKSLFSAVVSAAMIASSISSPIFAGGMDDDPIIGKVIIDQLEQRFTDGKDPYILEAQAWVGRDLNKLWFKIDSEWVDGENEELEVQALYSRAIDPYWDLQIGWRHNARPTPSQDWLALGFQGLAPYWVEVDAALFIADSGQVNARVSAEYEMMITQQLVLAPEASINFYSKNDAQQGIGSGLSDTQLGLRLRYEINREFAPYIGVNWTQKYGNTADHARDEGGDSSNVQGLVGIRAWF
ncbi:MAG: copper resistance protein B [Gammaproteobacteria bacterium]|nr:copper resistance protein B [Gammaproteobacteria bacterium]